MRALVILVVLVTLAVPPASAVGPRAPHTDRTEVVAALRVLHGWDARRAGAWAHADERTLRSLYLPGSAAARSDVRLLRTYTAHGLVVRRMVTQVFGVTVLHRDRHRITFRVLDRVAGGLVDDGDREVALPSTRPAIRRVELRRVAGTWKVAAVTR